VNTNILWTASVVAGSLIASRAEGAVIYREVFGRDSGAGNATLDYAGWNIRLGDSSTEPATDATDATGFFTGGGITSGTSTPADLMPVNSNPAASTIATGLVENFNGGAFWDRATLHWSDAYTVDDEVATVDSFQFH